MTATRAADRTHGNLAPPPSPAGDDAAIWHMRPHADPGAPTVLLLPHAGGGAQGFSGWTDWIPEDVRVLAAQYPGRGPRYGEPPARDLHELVAPLAASVSDLRGPLVLFGHSLGAIVGFELAWRLQACGTPVRGLVASAALAPHEGDLTGGYAHALRSQDSLLDMLRANGGLPEEILASPEMLSLVVDIVGADLRLLQRYEFGRRERTLRCPVAPVGGDRDPLTPTRSLWGWQELTCAPRSPRVLRGGHFYLLEHMAVVAGTVLDLLPKGHAPPRHGVEPTPSGP